jgi:hypothetical protein
MHQATGQPRVSGFNIACALCRVSLPSQHPHLSQQPISHFAYLMMTPPSTSSDGDLEAQRNILQPHRASYDRARRYPLS